MTLDIIIPVYQPGEEFALLLKKLHQQTLPADKIILANTEEVFWTEFVKASPEVKEYTDLDVFHVKKEEFDHGGTRRKAVSRSGADLFVCMTMDALPADEHLLEELVKPLMEEETIAASYARQLPKPGADVIECFTREFNYPSEDHVRTLKDLQTFGIKTFFCSNVCAAYRKSTYEKLGGFATRAIFNEDMIYAGGCIRAGFGIAYAAGAKVLHSHSYSGRQQYHRNFDLGVSQAEHPEVFESVPSEAEGKKLVKKTIRFLWNSGKGYLIPKLIWQSGCKYLGYRAGKNYRTLSRGSILRKTSNRAYFLKKWEEEKEQCAES